MTVVPRRAPLWKRFIKAKPTALGIFLGGIGSFAMMIAALAAFGIDRRITSCLEDPRTNLNIHGVRFAGQSHKIKFEPSDDPGRCPDIRTDGFTYVLDTDGRSDSAIHVSHVDSDMSPAAISHRAGYPLPKENGISYVTTKRMSEFTPTTHRGLFAHSGRTGLFVCNVFSKGATCQIEFTFRADEGWVTVSMWRYFPTGSVPVERMATSAIIQDIPLVDAIMPHKKTALTKVH